MNDTPGFSSSECDVVVVGAGAPAWPRGKRLVDAGLEVVVLEARNRLGGRASTVETAIGLPADIGCEWLHSAERNPWTGIAQRMGFDIDQRPPNWGARVSWLFGEAAQQDWMEARDSLRRRGASAAALEPEDRAEVELLEPGGRWNTLLGAISTWANGTELDRVSVKDHARYDNSANNWRVLKGYGTLISAYGAGLPARFGTVVSRIDHGGRRIVVSTNRGDISARAVVVTIPTNLLAAEAIRFVPALPDKLAAAAGLPLGVADKMFFAISGPADDLPRDRHLIGATDRTATGGYQMRAHGWPMIGAYFGGMLATELERGGADAMAAFALDELAGLFGADIRKRLTPVAHSSWVLDPYANGSYSCALPGHADDRLVLAAPVDERLHFVGEACSVNFFGTAHAAFLTAEAAAARIIATLGAKQAAAGLGALPLQPHRPDEAAMEIARLHVVAVAVEAQFQRVAPVAGNPLLAIQIFFLAGAAGLDGAAVGGAQDVPALHHVALGELVEEDAALHRHRRIGQAVDMAQIDRPALAMLGIGQPERARHRQEGREALGRVTGEVPHHRAADRESRRVNFRGIDRPALFGVGDHLVKERQIVAVVARRADMAPAMRHAVGHDEQHAQTRHRRDEIVGSRDLAAALPIAVHVKHHRQTALAVPVGRRDRAIGAVGKREERRLRVDGAEPGTPPAPRQASPPSRITAKFPRARAPWSRCRRR